MSALRHKKLDPMRVPRAGTTLRSLYDALLAGEEVAAYRVAGGHAGQNYLRQLRDFYGCEIASRGCPGGGSILLGRWDGPYFVPVERLDTYGVTA